MAMKNEDGYLETFRVAIALRLRAEFHADGCDWEECPVCGGRALGCDCIISEDDGDDE